MGLARRKFTKRVQAGCDSADGGGSSTAEVARAFEVTPKVFIAGETSSGTGRQRLSGTGKPRWDETRVAQLERKVGQQTLEIDFLKGCLQRIEEQRKLQALTGKPRFTSTFKRKWSKGAR